MFSFFLFSVRDCLKMTLKTHFSISFPRPLPPPKKTISEYWTLVMDVARRNNLKRILRCSQIMGKEKF